MTSAIFRACLTGDHAPAGTALVTPALVWVKVSSARRTKRLKAKEKHLIPPIHERELCQTLGTCKIIPVWGCLHSTWRFASVLSLHFCYFDGPYVLSAQTFFYCLFHWISSHTGRRKMQILFKPHTLICCARPRTHVRPCTSALASQPAVRRALCVLSKLIIATNVASSLVPRSRQRVSKLESRTKWRGEEGGRDKMMLDQPPTVKEGWKCASEERDSHSRRAFIVPYLCACLHLQGILDMLVLSQAEGKNDLIIHALKNNFEADAYFVKVMGKWLVFPKCAPSPSKSYLRKKKRESRKASFSFTHLFLPQEPSLHLHGGIKMAFFFIFFSTNVTAFFLLWLLLFKSSRNISM